MKIGNLVVTKYTSELGLIVGVDYTHCEVLIHKSRSKRYQTFRISKEHLVVINEE